MRTQEAKASSVLADIVQSGVVQQSWCGKESVVCSDTLCMVTPGPIAGENGFAHSFGVGPSTSNRIAAREW